MSRVTTSDEILACARQLIIAGGYNGFSYADIAEVVGIRKPSIHHHFPSKADLVRVLVEKYREDVGVGLNALDRHVSDPLEKLRAYTDYWASCLSEDTTTFCVCARLASDLPVLPETVKVQVSAHFKTLSGWLTTVLAEGARQGSLRFDGEASQVAEMFVATVHGAMLSARAHGDGQIFAIITAPLLERLTLKP